MDIIEAWCEIVCWTDVDREPEPCGQPAHAVFGADRIYLLCEFHDEVLYLPQTVDRGRCAEETPFPATERSS